MRADTAVLGFQTQHGIRVHVPASSANLSVGFDCMGMALDLIANFTIEPAERLFIGGCEDRFTGEDNLVWQSYLRSCRMLGLPEDPLAITIESPIPLSGGLGSSSCCVIAGVAAALSRSAAGWDKQQALDLASAIEGHPDNVAPALMGGMVSSFIADTGVWSVEYRVSSRLRFVVVAPPYEVRTEEARRILPKTVPLETVVWQIGRAVAMVKALETADGKLLRNCCHDKLHEPYRARLIPDYEPLQNLAYAAGADAFMISGSGSSMLALCCNDTSAERVFASFKAAYPGYWIQELKPQTEGTLVETL